jgi:hypothetical protein
MKVRTLRKRAQNKLDTFKWWAWENDTKMYYIRKVKPCKGYNAYCGDCNAVLFRQEMKRFPFTISEFNDYETRKQEWFEKHEAAHKAAQGKEYIMGDIDVPNAELGNLNLPTL